MAAKEEKWPECSPPVHHTSPRLLPSGWKACLHRGCWVCQLAHSHQHTQTLSLSILISLKIPSCNRINKTKVIPLSGFCLNTGPGCWNQDSGRPKHERHKGSSNHQSKLKSIIFLEISFFYHQYHHLMKAHPWEDLWSVLLPSDNHHWPQNHGDLVFCAHIYSLSSLQ